MGLRDYFEYENHLGEVFFDDRVYLNYTDLYDYSWSFDTLNSRVSRFYRSVTERKLPLTIVAEPGVDSWSIKSELTRIAEKDIIAKIPGKIHFWDFYTQGYITGSAISKYLKNIRFCKLDLTLTSDDPVWYRERFYRFMPTPSTDVGDGFDYPFGYPYDYSTKSKTTQNIECNSIIGNEFRMTVYGSVSNPSIQIGGHKYSIDGTIGTGETLLIDTLSKKITLTSQTGQKLNWFDRRNRANYIFEPIPSGINTVSWDGSFGVDLTVIEKWSSPI